MIHIFVLIIPHKHTVSAREPMSVGEGGGRRWLRALAGRRQVGLAQGLTPWNLFSSESRQASISTLVSSSRWKITAELRDSPPTAADLEHRCSCSGRGGHSQFVFRCQETGHLETLIFQLFLKQGFLRQGPLSLQGPFSPPFPDVGIPRLR